MPNPLRSIEVPDRSAAEHQRAPKRDDCDGHEGLRIDIEKSKHPQDNTGRADEEQKLEP